MRLALALSLSWCLTFTSWALLWVIFANGKGWQWWYDLEYSPILQVFGMLGAQLMAIGFAVWVMSRRK